MKLPSTVYFGKPKLDRTLQNYHVSISIHSDTENIPYHYHHNPYISLNLGVPYIEHSTISKKRIPTGKIIYRTPDYKHKNSFEYGNGICFNIEFFSNNCAKEMHALNCHRSGNLSLELFKILVKVLENFDNDKLDCMISKLLTTTNEGTRTQKKSSWYTIVINNIHENYSKALSLTSLAKSVNIHPNYLARKFKELSGMTVGDYIRNTRMAKAVSNIGICRRLTDIALEAGYYDQSHFTKSFQSTFGISPKKLHNLLTG